MLRLVFPEDQSSSQVWHMNLREGAPFLRYCIRLGETMMAAWSEALEWRQGDTFKTHLGEELIK